MPNQVQRATKVASGERCTWFLFSRLSTEAPRAQIDFPFNCFLNRCRQFSLPSSHNITTRTGLIARSTEAAIRGVMSEAAQQGYITHEVAEGFKHVKGLKQVANKDRRKATSRTAISKVNMQRMVNAPDTSISAGTMHRALLLTLATGGMRISEAVNLKSSDIQFQTNGDSSGWVAYVLGKNMAEPEARPLGKQAKQVIDHLATGSGRSRSTV